MIFQPHRSCLVYILTTRSSFERSEAGGVWGLAPIKKRMSVFVGDAPLASGGRYRGRPIFLSHSMHVEVIHLFISDMFTLNTVHVL
jgi:hypothetical protein